MMRAIFFWFVFACLFFAIKFLNAEEIDLDNLYANKWVAYIVATDKANLKSQSVIILEAIFYKDELLMTSTVEKFYNKKLLKVNVQKDTNGYTVEGDKLMVDNGVTFKYEDGYLIWITEDNIKVIFYPEEIEKVKGGA
jgi:hypothetical protein